ncbi:MAG TPA: hypothetical protein PKJ51_03805 [Methanothrix sp.]|jgi:hypothetical protein|nr:hypothetical protein [Methanothrix sp.]
MDDADYYLEDVDTNDEAGLDLLSRLLAIEREMGRDLRPEDIPGDVMDKVMEWGDLHYERASDLSRVLASMCRRILAE